MDCSPSARCVFSLPVVLAIGVACCRTPSHVAAVTDQHAAAQSTVAARETLRPELVVQCGHTERVRMISFSPDGKLLASSSGEGGAFSLDPNITKLWDVATGMELRTILHGSSAVWIGFSADGRKVAIKGADEIADGEFTVWDVTSGDELKGETVGEDYVSNTVTSDGKIAAIIDGKNIILRDAATGQVIRTLASRTSDFQKVLFSPDSTILATGGDRFSIRLWDLRAGVLRTLEGHTDYPYSAGFSPDSRLFATGGADRVIRLWDVASGRQIKTFAGHTGHHVREVAFSPDGKRLVSFDELGFKLWDVASGRELAAAAGEFDSDDIHFSPQGNLLAATAGGGVTLWSAATGEVIRVLPGETHSVSFNSDGTVLMTFNYMKQVDLWNVANGQHIASIHPSVKDNEDVWLMCSVFSPDGKTLAISELDSSTPTSRFYIHDPKTGKRLRTITCANSFIGMAPFVFTGDSNWILCDEDKVFEVGTSKEIEFKSEEGVAGFRQMWDLAPHRYFQEKYTGYSPNGKYWAWCTADGALQLNDPRTGRDIAKLIGIDETDWLVATDDGFFDGSPTAWKQIYWRFNNDTFSYAPLEAFFNEFYHPGLLADVLAGKPPSLPEGKDLSRIDRRQPVLTLSQVAATGADQSENDQKRSVTLSIDVEEDATPTGQSQQPETSGARDVRLFRNGSLVKAWRGDVFSLGKPDGCDQLTTAANGPRRVRCQVEVPIVAGANEFTAYAFNDANVKSVDATLSISGGDDLRRTPTLHVLAIGINEYDYQPLNLRFAVADAQAFGKEVSEQQDKLKNFAQVGSKLITDANATKRNILAELENVARTAQPEDTVIVYFAGHGTAHDNHFYLIPHDIGYAEDSPQSDDDGLAELLRRSISDRELELAFEKVDAEKILFVVDACNSGQALEADEKRRGPMNSKGLAQLAYEKGMYVLTAAQSFQAAHEASKLGHGLLTHVLVNEGLKRPAADCDPSDNRVDIREWLDYATRRVPQIQLHEMQVAQSRGASLAFADDEQHLSLDQRGSQRPRVYYRSDVDTTPLIVARVSPDESSDQQLTIIDDQPANATHDGRINQSPNQELAAGDPGIRKRGMLGVFRKGPAEDLKAEIVEEQNGVYHTPNSTQAVVGMYGKLIEGKRMLGKLARFEQRGVVQQLDRVRRFETVHRQGTGSGKDFLSLFGSRRAWQVVDLGAKITGGRQQEVSFEIVGIRLEQSDVINALNADADALAYFGYLDQKGEPPCVVLENLMLTNYAASQTTTVGLGVNAQTAVSSDSVNAQSEHERTTSTELASPVIRCYQMYQVKLHQNRVVELLALDP